MIGEGWKRRLIIQANGEFGSIHLNTYLIPLACFDFPGDHDRLAALPIHHLEEGKRLTDPAGAHVIIILGILVTKNQTSHGLDNPFDEFEFCLKCSIFEGIVFKDEHGVTFISQVL